ncbi:hypothetical protein Tsubulata_039744 [Turnera subulata]|uniref:Serpin domain-containing protein n=1 Tax=Turnera subulata TaxID=218843 RepID=A0A9Q0FGB0_9ROSI|nr:hypothetical protein Tsubulata_039744 [Turnera subulata]
MESLTRLAIQVFLTEIDGEEDSNKNVVLSPLSLNCIVNMVAAGTKGETLKQFLGFLDCKSVDDLKTQSSRIMELAIKLEKSRKPQAPTLSIVNGIWVDRQFTIKPSYQQMAKDIYKAEAKTVDFRREGEKVRKEVNLWVEKHTKKRIKNFLPGGCFSGGNAGIMLANALYFRAKWCSPFRTSKTKREDFHLLNGQTIKVPTMKKEHTSELYASFEGFQVLCMAFRSIDHKVFNMYFLLPDERDGLEEMLQRLNDDPGLLSNLGTRKGRFSKIWIPKLKFSYEFQAKETMEDLGLVLPFRPAGEFTEMVVGSSPSSDQLYVSDIIHKSCIEVDEKGAKGAAATGLHLVTMARRTCKPPPPRTFVADHPFMFMIEGHMDHEIVFTGVRRVFSTLINYFHHGVLDTAGHTTFSHTNRWRRSLQQERSKGETLKQFLGFLDCKSIDDLKTQSSRIMEHATKLEKSCKPQAPTFSIVNGIWVDRQFTIKPSYQQMAKDIYKAEAKTVDFRREGEKVRKEVNLWVEKHTKKRIKNLLPQGCFSDGSAGIVLANALYFRAKWCSPFHTSKTEREDFHLLNGQTIKVPTMKKEHTSGLYASFEGFQVLCMAFRSIDHKVFNMYFLLPDERDGLEEMLQRLNDDPGLLSNLGTRKGRFSKIWIPKLKFSYEFQAKETMEDLGLVLPFRPAGEFTEMVVGSSPSSDQLYVSDIIHKSCIEVDEKGAKAAAATGLLYLVRMAARRTCKPPPPRTFVADHPFMFMIEGHMDHEIVFTGVVLNPLLKN